jgi:hypothetical protein
VHALVEEYAGAAVQLGYDDTFGSVDDERTGRCHIRDVAEIHVLNPGFETLVVGVGAGQAELGLQRNVVCETSIKTLFDRILGRIDEIVDKIEPVIVSGVFNRKNFLENLIESFVFPAVRGGLELEEVFERLQLDLQKVGVFQDF